MTRGVDDIFYNGNICSKLRYNSVFQKYLFNTHSRFSISRECTWSPSKLWCTTPCQCVMGGLYNLTLSCCNHV